MAIKQKGRPKKKGVYFAELDLNYKTYRTSGNTLMETLNNFDNSATSLFVKGVIVKTPKNTLVVKKDGEQQSTTLTGWQLKRFFHNPTMRKLVAKEFTI